MTPGEETERMGEGRTVLEDTSRVGDVTGKKMEKGVTALVFSCPKKHGGKRRLTGGGLPPVQTKPSELCEPWSRCLH